MADPRLAETIAAAREEGRREAGWRCFHCGATFVDRVAAAEHFGESETSAAACTIDVAEYREMEEYTARCRAEDSDTDRAMHRLRAEYGATLRREEEKGYARGLVDGQREVWRPIETAPKDGVRVLLCRASEHEPWDAHVGQWRDGGWYPMAAMPFYNPNPTHWLPLPAPPR